MDQLHGLTQTRIVKIRGTCLDTYLKTSPTPYLFLKNPSVYIKGVGEDKFDRDCIALSDRNRPPRFKRQKSINVIKGHYRLELSDNKDNLCKPDGDDEDAGNDES